MKKLFLFAVLTVLGLNFGNAQFRFGVEAGVNICHTYETNINKVGFNAGVIIDYSFNKHWYLNTSPKLSSKPCGEDFENGEWANDPSNYHYRSTYTPYFFNLPVRAGFVFNPAKNFALSIEIGPMIGIGLWGRGNERISSFKDQDIYRSSNVFNKNKWPYYSSSRFEYGVSSRIGLEVKSHYTVGLEYDLTHNNGEMGNMSGKSFGTFSINIGYKF